MSTPFVKGQPYGGWARSLTPFVTFDTHPEFVAAIALDQSAGVEWWLRNDPPKFRLRTPLGTWFEPDFLYGRLNPTVRGILEIKGGFLWQGPMSPEAIKAEAACDWVAAQNAIAAAERGPSWEFAVVIDSDVEAAPHLDALRGVARRHEP